MKAFKHIKSGKIYWVINPEVENKTVDVMGVTYTNMKGKTYWRSLDDFNKQFAEVG